MNCGDVHGVITTKKWVLAVTLLLASCAVAQQATSTWQGSWIATAGPSRFRRGHWFARVLPDAKNAASGSWSLVSESNQVVLEGTWSARIQQSRTVSGTWDAAMADFNGKTFEDMLKRTAEKQI